MLEPTVSIVIPTYNEENTIVEKLKNTLALDYPRDKMEIVIVDGSSTDKTVDLIFEIKKNLSEKDIIEIIQQEKRMGLPIALNEGYSRSTGEIIVKTDCDSMLDEGALNHAVKTFEDERIGCVTGRGQVLGSEAEKEYRSLNTRVQILESKIDSTIIAHGPFTAFRKKLLVKIDEDSLADDSELSLKIRKQNYRSIINPDIIFYEKTSEEGRDEQKIRRASGLVRLFWRNKSTFFNPKYGKFGLIVFPFNFCVILVTPILFSPLIVILSLFSIRGGTFLETQLFLLKAMGRLLSKEATVFWEPDMNIRGD